MELFILNKELELKGILENYTYLKWIRRFYKCGEFELHCKLNNKTINLIQEGNILFKKDDNEIGFIETIEFKNLNGVDSISIKGKFVTAYLGRRINRGRIDFNGTCEELMRKLVNDNAINTLEHRKIPNLILGDCKNFLEKINYQNSFGNILDEINKISMISEIGYNIIFDYSSKKLIFNTYKGIDRSYNQDKIAPCIFSRNFENILSQNLFRSSNDYKNTCLIAGSGEGEKRKLASIENGFGLSRYELFVDARDLSDKEKIINDKGEEVEADMSNDKYKNLLLQRGSEKLCKLKKIQTFDCKINTKGNNKYKVDYDLGDLVTIVDSSWNIQINTQITEIEEIYENGKLDINPIFGNNIPTVLDIIKRRLG
jgi:hypothetical protein